MRGNHRIAGVACGLGLFGLLGLASGIAAAAEPRDAAASACTSDVTEASVNPWAAGDAAVLHWLAEVGRDHLATTPGP